jgi:predicted P-loop ATPase
MIESLDALKKWRLSDSLLRIIEFGRDDQWQGKVSDDTDSGWQFRGIKMLIERGVTDTIIKGLITDPRWGISRSTFKGRNRTVDDYADRQIVRAHAALVEERKSRFPDDGIEEQYEKLMDEKEDDIFAPLFEITADTRGELYNAKGEPRLLAKLKVQDRRRFEQLWTQFQNRRVRDLIGLGREVNKIIKAAGKRQAKKKSTEPNDFLRDSNGFPKPTQENIRLAIEKLGVTLVHNDFSSKPSIDGLGEKFDGLLQDHAIAELWLRIDAEFSFRPRMDFFTTVVINVCRRNAFHPVKDYLDSLVWDSKPRIETWLIDYCHAEDTPFNRAVGRMFLIAAVRRIKRPGEKFDTMLILEGPEGNNKSGVFRTLAKKPGWFSDSIRFTDDDKQIIEKAAGKWILEIADMQGLTKADFDRVKALLSRQSDNARAAYARLASEVHRQFVIGATTNLDSYLASLTGNRRNWCVRTPHWIELDILNGAVDQLWAEAVAQEIDEPDLFLPRELWDEAKIVQAEREIENPFADRIDELVGSDEGYVFALDMIEALSIPLERAGPREYLKLAHAMSKLGFEKKQRARNKRRMTCYERISPGTVPKMFRFRFDQDERRWIRAASWESKSGEADDFDLDEFDEPVEADEPDED